MTPQLHAELWTSWAAVLRSYAACHGLNATHHAVVEVSTDEIVLRVDARWLRFTPTTMQHSNAERVPFSLTEDGKVILNHAPAEEMDMAAERLAREMLHPMQ